MLTKLLYKSKPFFSAQYLKKIESLFNRKQYQQILQIQNMYNPSINQVKNNYYRLIKQYHSDNCQNDQTKAKLYEQITKVIIKSYHAIDKKLFDTRKDIKEDTYLEDQICMELFNKKYAQVKYWMYEKGNQKSKNLFFQKLFQRTGRRSRATDREYYNYDFTQNNTTSQSNNYTSSTSYNKSQASSSGESSNMGLALAGVATLAALFYFGSKKSYEPAPKTTSYSSSSTSQANKYSPEQILKIQQKKAKVKQQKASVIINSIVKDHPPSLQYPSSGPQPHIMKQLIQYSIASDIHLYEVLPQHFETQQKSKIIKQGLNKQKLFHLTRIKPNTTMTLSLQAERALQNTYVKVKDVINQINTTGTFKPPQVFIRFHGYIMFQIRQKPISLRNYRDTDYISLFDLYFDYYSPIFLKKDNFSQYLVCKDQMEYFGWVNLNNKKCNPVYLNAGDKAAYFHSERGKQMGIVYQNIWYNFYRDYQDRWKQGGNTKKRCGI